MTEPEILVEPLNSSDLAYLDRERISLEIHRNEKLVGSIYAGACLTATYLAVLFIVTFGIIHWLFF